MYSYMFLFMVLKMLLKKGILTVIWDLYNIITDVNVINIYQYF